MSIRRGAGGIGLLAVAGALFLLGGAAAQQRGQPRSDRWEYGEFTILGDKAYFTTQERRVRLDPPSSMPGSHTEDGERVLVALNVKIMHMNRLGDEGWEFVTAASIRDSATYLMRRRK